MGKTEVSITIDLDGTTKTFKAVTESETPGFQIAKHNIMALENEARSWINARQDAGGSRAGH